MAQIPEYRQQVVPDALPGVRENVDTPLAAFGGGIGQSLSELGSTAETAAMRAMQMVNYAKLTQARLQFETTVDAQAQSDWFNRKNDKVEGMPQQAAEFIGKARKDAVGGLNRYQTMEFDRQTLRYQRGMQNAVERQTRQQTFKFADATAEQSQIKAMRAAASQFTDPDLVNIQYGENEKAIAISNDLNGRDGATADEYAVNSRTKFVMGVARGFQTGNDPEGAMKFLADHKGQIDPTAHNELLTQLKVQSDVLQSQRATAQLVQLHTDGVNGTIDYAAVRKDAREKYDGSVLDQIIRRADAQDLEQKRVGEEDAAKGLHNKAAAMGTGENPLDWTYSDMHDRLKMGDKDILAVQEQQLRAKDKEQRPQKDPKALADRVMALKDRARAFDPDADDAEHTQFRAIDHDITQLKIEDGAAVSGKGGLVDMWNAKNNPDQKIDVDLHKYLYKNANGKPGGLQQEIHKAVQDGASSWGHWMTPRPSAKDIDARAATIFQSVKHSIITKELKSPDEVREWLNQNPDYKRMMSDSLLGHWKKKLSTGVSAADSAPVKGFNPADIAE